MTYRTAPPVRRQAFFLLLAALAAASTIALLLVGGAAAEPSLADKRAQAAAVLAEIQRIDSEVAHAAEAYNLANIKLDGIRTEQVETRAHLKIARRNLSGAQRRLAERLVAIYTSGSPSTAVDVIVGAESLEDLINRLDTVERVSTQDADVLDQVTSFRNQVKVREAKLAKAHAAQERVVAERAAHQRAVEAKLRERQALLSTIREEIQRIEARERARQAALARQARARLARSSQAQASAPVEAAAPAAEEASAEPASAPAARHGGVVGIAMKYLGVPCRWGGASPSGFDCSGFVMYVYAQVGVSLPHNAAAQYGYGSPVSKSALQPGDLVFFNGLGHNGIYIGGGQFIHSPHTGDVVKISNLGDSWYAQTWVGARRL